MLKKYIGSNKIQRITIDLDSKNVFKKFWSLFILKIFGFKEFDVRESASKKGYHITAFHDVGFDKKKLLKIRKIAGDDEMRIFLDSMGKRQINVLFDYKKKRKIILK